MLRSRSSSPTSPIVVIARVVLLVCVALHNNSCNSSGLSYAFTLDQPLNFVMTSSLRAALDPEERSLFQRAALHAIEALGTEGGFAMSADTPLPASDNAPVQLTLGQVDGDCIGDRAGYVRWRPNNVLQVCPSMLRERSALMVYSLIMHELGHVLGGNHVACDGESLMAPDLNCPTARYRRASGAAPVPAAPENLLWYSAIDLREICQHTSGGACSQLPDSPATADPADPAASGDPPVAAARPPRYPAARAASARP